MASPTHGSPVRVGRVQAIEKHARHWTDADMLVFDSYTWWTRPKLKILWGSFESPDTGIYKDLDKHVRSDCHISVLGITAVKIGAWKRVRVATTKQIQSQKKDIGVEDQMQE
ncbi:unnamed protein product [Ilex paraguariensis]|uniref:Trichome birefringence-like C-terminal domain-containing protein n=1 Tax=Ilex paraguariensis TaxID=185542 RepID=A0ABC8RZT6_9AQUA